MLLEMSRLMVTATQLPTSKDKGVDEFLEEVKIQIKLDKRLQLSNSGLEKRKLISVQRHETCCGVAGISLTIEGYDLGRKYSSWWTRTGEWFEEYKNHWIWIIVSFLGGVVGALLINWLSSGANGE